MALRRIQKELQEIMRDPTYGCDARPEGNDMFHWTRTIFGPEDSPYETGFFYIDITFPDLSGSHFPRMDIANHFRNDRADFDRTAREWTQRYAT